MREAESKTKVVSFMSVSWPPLAASKVVERGMEKGRDRMEGYDRVTTPRSQGIRSAIASTDL